MRQNPPSFGIVSRDCYDANLLAALRKAQARAEVAEARVKELTIRADIREEALTRYRAAWERAVCALAVERVANAYERLSRSPSLKEQP